MKRALVAFLVPLLVSACDDPPTIPEHDAGPDAGPDAGSAPTDGGLRTVDSGTDAGPPPAALVRFVHAAPDAPTVSFHASDYLVAPGVYYRGATPYVRVRAGEGVLAAVDADEATVAQSGTHNFEDGARYVATLIDPPDAEPTIAVERETEPSGSDPLSVRVLNATGRALDVDVDGQGAEPEVDDLAPGAWSDWIGLPESSSLRPIVTAAETEPFSIVDALRPWVDASARALLVVTGRPDEVLPSETEGLSIVLVLDASEDASPVFVLRPDPRIAILQASPALATAQVWADPSTWSERHDIAPAIAYGDFVETRLPPGAYFVGFATEDQPWGVTVRAEFIGGHRYLLVTRGNPESYDADRWGAFIVRDAIEGDRFVVLHASPDAPTLRWYAETAPGTFTPLEQFEPLAFGQRSHARGIELDAAQALAVAREDRSEPNVWFEVPSPAPARGFVVLAGSYLAGPSAADGITMFYVDAPARGPWSVTRVAATPESGPLPDELPPPP